MSQKTSKLKKTDIEKANSVGFDFSEKKSCGSFVQIDNKTNYFSCKNKGIEIIPTPVALKKYSWAKKYLWKLVDKSKDKYTKEVSRFSQEGYFIRAKKGAKVKVPIQACLYIRKNKLRQRVHNIIIAEENSSLNVVTGCAISPKASFGLHIGVSEFFIKKNASLSFTMIHNWDENTIVRPRTVSEIEKNGKFVSNYISLKKIKDLEMYPIAHLKGEGAACYLNSILFAPKNSLLDVGAGVFLKAKNTKAEVISRAMSSGGKIIARGKIVGEVSNTKAHLECQGLILKRGGKIYAIPELESKEMGADLSHEAAVGKIAQEEIEYLMARGISKNNAISMIVRGFLNLKINGLPKEIDNEIKEILSC